MDFEKIYADFTYYRDCTFSGSSVAISGETYVKCIDHCTIEDDTCQYHISQTESYPIRYYNVIKDVEKRYSDENNIEVDVAMCDFFFKPSVFNDIPVVMTPVLRQEELLGFSRLEKPVDNIYIDRGYATVLDRHLRIGEVRDFEQLEKYGNGLFELFDDDKEVN